MKDSKSKPESTEALEGTETTPRPLEFNRLTELIIGAAIEVHRSMGPGLMEGVYEQCLCYELSQRSLKFQRQLELPISYKGIKLDCGFRMDLVVEDAVVLELKTVDRLLPVHSAELLTYLKLSGKNIGLLINFNEPVLKNGLKRLRNFPPPAPSGTSSASVLSGFQSFLNSEPLCLCGEPEDGFKRLRDFPPAAPSGISSTSVFSGFQTFLNSVSPCLCGEPNSGLKRLRNFPPPAPSGISSTSVFSGFQTFLNSVPLCLCGEPFLPPVNN